MAMRLTEEQLDWLAARVPDAPRSGRGGRPPVDKRQALRGIFWILDNGAKWKDLPRRFGSKSAVHRWFTLWVSSRNVLAAPTCTLGVVWDGVAKRDLSWAWRTVDASPRCACVGFTTPKRRRANP